MHGTIFPTGLRSYLVVLSQGQTYTFQLATTRQRRSSATCIHSFRLVVVGFATPIELQFENELATAAEVVMIDFCPCAADAAISILLKLPF
jgi:hypothetical protein